MGTAPAFSLDVVVLARDGHVSAPVLHATASVVGSIVAVLLGACMLRRARAAALPLEEEP